MKLKKRIISAIAAATIAAATFSTPVLADDDYSYVLYNFTAYSDVTYTYKEYTSSTLSDVMDGYTNGFSNDYSSFFGIDLSWKDTSIAGILFNSGEDRTVSFADSSSYTAMEISHDTHLGTRLPSSNTKVGNVTFNVPITVKSGKFLFVSTIGSGSAYKMHGDSYTNVYFNNAVTLEENATLLLENKAEVSHSMPDTYTGVADGSTITANSGSTVRLGGAKLIQQSSNTSPYISANGATVIVQEGSSTKSAFSGSFLGKNTALPDVSECSPNYSHAVLTTSSGSLIDATNGSEVYIYGGELSTDGDNPVITVDSSSTLTVDMQTSSYTLYDDSTTTPYITASESGVSPIAVNGGTVVLGDLTNISSVDDDTPAITLTSGSTVKYDGISITVKDDDDSDEDANYVDNDGKVHLLSGSTITLDDDANVSLSDYIVLDDGAYTADSTDDGVTYVVTTVADTFSNISDTVTVSEENAETETTTGTTTSTKEDSLISGVDVTTAYANAAAEYTGELINSDSTITKIEVKRVDSVTDKGYDTTSGDYTLEIEPLIVYTVYKNDETEGTTYTEELDLSGKTASFTISVPTGSEWEDGDTIKAAHHYDGNVEYLSADVEDSTLTYTTTKGFSTWVFSAENEYADESADTITVTFSEYKVDENGDEDEDGTAVPGKYYINIKGDNDIYRFMAAQLLFDIDTDDNITYTIEPSTGMSMTTASTAYGTVYEFNADGETVHDGVDNTHATPTPDGAVSDVYIAAGDEFPIGIVTFEGVGTVNSFGVNTTDYDDNMVQTAVYEYYTLDMTGNITRYVTDNSIVKTYTTSGEISGTTDGRLSISALDKFTLSLATTELTVNVMFPNVVSEQEADYTKMSLEYNNVMLTEAETVEIGSDTAEYGTVNDAPMSGDEWTGYTFTITVPTDYATTLKFSGDGYRTYRTSIVPIGETATVTVWNNVMDDDETVVISNEDADTGVMTAVTFLAGDIVNQGTIDLYDLSAVVSYFGKTDIVDDNYIKCDLNRDGKIDSKDIAMVLVSWGK